MPDAWFDNGMVQLYQADARSLPIPDNSVDCVVTSPPYWGLRDYGLGEWVGGDVDCNHTISMPTKWNDPKRGTNYTRPEVAHRGGDASRCFLCEAQRIDNSIGLEPTPEEYCANMVEVFREVWRVLKPTGTLWLNLGDSYASGGKAGGQDNNAPSKGVYVESFRSARYTNQHNPKTAVSGLKPKDLVGIPWRVAFALQADGWYLRSDIIWSKPNPMPESATDRPTKAHEYVFLMTKSPRYYYDADAIREANKPESEERYKYSLDGSYTPGWAYPNEQRDKPQQWQLNPAGRNKRTVWEIATQPYPEAHFATYPEKLVEPCILAGCPQDGVVLDPFAGSGTTLAVAQRLGRRAIGTDLSAEYLELASKRLGRVSLPLF